MPECVECEVELDSAIGCGHCQGLFCGGCYSWHEEDCGENPAIDTLYVDGDISIAAGETLDLHGFNLDVSGSVTLENNAQLDLSGTPEIAVTGDWDIDQTVGSINFGPPSYQGAITFDNTEGDLRLGEAGVLTAGGQRDPLLRDGETLTGGAAGATQDASDGRNWEFRNGNWHWTGPTPAPGETVTLSNDLNQARETSVVTIPQDAPINLIRPPTLIDPDAARRQLEDEFEEAQRAEQLADKRHRLKMQMVATGIIFGVMVMWWMGRMIAQGIRWFDAWLISSNKFLGGNFVNGACLSFYVAVLITMAYLFYFEPRSRR